MSQIENTLLVDSACKQIKEDIYNRILVSGKKINVRELSERYNISVTPIKQALNRLTSEGIVESIPRKGMVVRKLTATDMVEYSEIREMILLYSVPFAIERSTADESFLIRLQESFQEHTKQLSKAYTDEYYRDVHNYYLQVHNLDEEFHLMMVSAVGNPKLEAYYRSIGAYFKIVYLYREKQLHRVEETLKEHEAILEALRRGNSDELRKVLIKHFDNVKTDYANELFVQEP